MWAKPLALVVVALLTSTTTGGASQEDVTFMMLLRYSTTNGNTLEELGAVNNGVVAAALLAAKHCNERYGGIVSALSQESMAGCEALKFNIRAFDTESEPSVAVRSYLSSFRDSSLVIGATRSACTMPVSILAAANDIPMISYWSTSDELSDRSIHSTFLRTIPSDGATSEAIASLFSFYKFGHVSMLYIDDSYGNNFRDGLSGQCDKKGIRLHPQSFKRKDKESIRQALKTISASKLNILFLVTFAEDVQTILEIMYEYGMYGDGTLLVFSDSITTDVLTTVVQSNPLTAEVINGTQLVAAVGGDNSHPAFERLESFWQSAGADDVRFLQEYFPGGSMMSEVTDSDFEVLPRSNNPAFAIHLNESAFFQNTLQELQSVAPYAYDSVASACRASCLSYRNRFDNATSLRSSRASQTRQEWLTGLRIREQVMKPEFPFSGTSGRVQFDLESGSRNPSTAFFKVRNLFVSSSLDKVYSVSTANWANESTWEMNGTRFPPGDRLFVPLDSDPPVEVMNQIPDGLRIMAYVMFGILGGVAISFFLWLVYHKQHRVVKKSQPEFLMIFLFGSLVTAAAIIANSMDDMYQSLDGASAACNASLCLVSLGTTLIVSALTVKLYRIERIFRNMTLKALLIKTTQLYRAIFALVVMNLALLMLWTFLTPFHFERIVLSTNQFNFPLASYGKCALSSDNRVAAYTIGTLIILFHLTMYIVGGVIAYRVRNINPDFQESRFLAFALIFQAQLYMLAAPIYIAISESEVSTKFIVFVFVIFLSTMASVLLVFIPKVLAVTYSSDSEGHPRPGHHPQQNKPRNHPHIQAPQADGDEIENQQANQNLFGNSFQQQQQDSQGQSNSPISSSSSDEGSAPTRILTESNQDQLVMNI